MGIDRGETMIKLIKTQLDDIRHEILRWYETDEPIYHFDGMIVLPGGLFLKKEGYPESHYLDEE